MAISKETSLDMLVWFKEVLDDEYGQEFARLSTLGSGEQNVIENISIDGRLQSIDDTKTANLNLSAYYKKSELAGALSSIYILNETINNLSDYESLKPASTTELGGVIVGSGLSINSDGVLSAIPTSTIVDYESLKPANTTELGGIIVGDGLSITNDGILSVTVQGGQSNVIEKISVDGTIQPVVGKTAILGLSAYAKKSDVGSGIRMQGSVSSINDLPANPEVGDLYNIKNAGGFDGYGIAIQAGDNVVYTANNKWDVMAGFVDTSNFVEKVEGKQLSTEDFTTAEKDKLAGLNNFSLSTASETLKGGIMIGVGLSMSGDTLNAVTNGVFIGAKATLGGTSGLVPAPAEGRQNTFLRGDCYWAEIPAENINLVVSSGASNAVITAPFSYPPNVQGALWMDIVEGKHCLKLRYGDYEYIYLPDSSNPETINPASLNSFVKGKIYYLNTVPSVENGGMWYKIVNGEPVIWLHREGSAYSFDLGYKPDMIAYKGTQESLYSFLPLKSSTRDLLNRTWTTSITEPVIEKNDFGIYALRNMDKSLTNTVATNSGWKHTFPIIGNNRYTGLTTATIDFWLSWNADTSEEKTAVVADGNTTATILRCICAPYAGVGSYYKYFAIRNTSLSSDNTPIPGTESLLEDDAAKRLHVAIIFIGGISNTKFLLYINGTLVQTAANVSYWLKSIEIFHYCVGAETAYRGLYIDHFRIWNKVIWTKNFEPPKEEDYLIW